MEISSVNATLKRIEEIEKNLNQVLGIKEPEKNSFEDILNNKINQDEDEPEENIFRSSRARAPKQEILNLIEKYAKKYNLDKGLISAVIRAESGFNSNAVSRVGAMGLMQLMPGTARGLGVTNAFDPEQNIAGGTKYLKNLINKYDSVKLGLAAYNAGSGAVQKYGGVPPYKETQNYVKRILNDYYREK